MGRTPTRLPPGSDSESPNPVCLFYLFIILRQDLHPDVPLPGFDFSILLPQPAKY